tara:strand:- start:129 stop:536 length:408 start_codon:yes stop_codon:yes gene_type:complete
VEFLSVVIDRSVNPEQSTRFRSKNFNDYNFTVLKNIKEMMQLKMDALKSYFENYTISSNQILKYAMLIWEYFQNLCKLKIVVWHQMIIQNTFFCLRFIRLGLKYLELPFHPISMKFVITVYPSLIKRFAKTVINS